MSTREKFSEAELDMLTAEERAGLEDESLVDDLEEGEGEGESGGEEDGTDKGKGKSPEEEGKAKADEDADAAKLKADADAAAAAAAALAGNQPAADGAGDQVERTAQQPVLPQWKAPADAKERLAAIETQADEIAKKFDDGELTAAEMRAQLKPLDAEKDGIKEAVFKASMSQDMTVENWTRRSVPDFLTAHPEYKKGTALYAALDHTVREMQSGSDNPLDPEILVRAHKKITDDLAAAGMAKPGAKTPAADPAKKREIPPTLAAIPGDDNADVSDDGEFAAIDRLSGTAYEQAISKMTPEQQERFLNR